MLRINGKDVTASSTVIENYINQSINNLCWQKQVIGFFDTTSGLPEEPISGDRYIAVETDEYWTRNNIYTYNDKKNIWEEVTPTQGFALHVLAEDTFYVFLDENIGWIKLSVLINHNELSGINGDGEYMHLPPGGEPGQLLVNLSSGAGIWANVIVDGGQW